MKKHLWVLYGAVLLWVNIYIGRDLFFAEYTGHSNSVHGLWMSMARLAGEHWFRPSWWPYFDGGIPFEHAYMPLAPALTALYAKLAGSSVAHAFNVITGLAYCLGPLALFAMALTAKRTRKKRWALVLCLPLALAAFLTIFPFGSTPP